MAPRETRWIRSATLVGYSEAATAVGLNPEVMLERVGIDIRCLSDPEILISLDSYLELLAVSAASSNCADFGVRAAIARGIPDLGLVSLLMREAETVEQAIQFYSSHLTLHADGTVIRLDKRFDSPLIVIEIVGQTKEQSIQATQFCVAGIMIQIRWLIGAEFQPEMVSFSHPRPRNLQVAQSFFKCPVSYNQALSGIVLRREDLKRPIVTSPPFLRKLALRHLGPLISTPDSFSARVSRLIRQMLPEGECTSEAVAEYFNVDRRTLNRRLEREGEAFTSVLQRVRMEAALRGMQNADSSLTAIADMTGFESLSSFSRWFQRSFGCTATEWRSRPGRGKSDDLLPAAQDSTSVAAGGEPQPTRGKH